MTKLEIFSGLFDIYTRALEDYKLQETDKDRFECLLAYGVQSGACSCMGHNFGANSDEMRANHNLVSDIIDQYKDFGSPFWGLTPGGEKRESGIECLEYRIEILTEILNELAPSPAQQ